MVEALVRPVLGRGGVDRARGGAGEAGPDEPRLDAVRRELDEYFERRRTGFDLPIDWALVTPFGRRVLQATASIPFGEVSTYGRIAERAGNPKAARATGNALGSNPMPIVVPCHRVLHTGGHGIGNYTGGVHRKEALLRLEGVLLG